MTMHAPSAAASSSSRPADLFSLQGKTAIVTGAAVSGIGFAIVEALAGAGANVAMIYHSNKSAIEGASKIEQTYGVQCAYAATATIRCDGLRLC